MGLVTGQAFHTDAPASSPAPQTARGVRIKCEFAGQDDGKC